MIESSWWDELVTPALLRSARATYGRVIRNQLAHNGFEDVPANGPFVLGGLRIYGPGAQSSATTALGVTKQAASQLIDTLVLRGYVERTPDPEDRRRMNLALTDRGQAAADAVRTAVESVDQQLAARLSTTEVATMRAGLAALSEIGRPDST